eukprot:SAG31_NODE_737_length_12474_cov_14.694303_6_plen_597_part_00
MPQFVRPETHAELQVMGIAFRDIDMVLIGGYGQDKRAGLVETCGFSHHLQRWVASCQTESKMRSILVDHECDHLLAPLRHGLIGPAVCATRSGGIFVAGGFTPDDTFSSSETDTVGHQHSAVQMFDPKTKLWQQLPSMNFKRAGACACLLDGWRVSSGNRLVKSDKAEHIADAYQDDESEAVVLVIGGYIHQDLFCRPHAPDVDSEICAKHGCKLHGSIDQPSINGFYRPTDEQHNGVAVYSNEEDSHVLFYHAKHQNWCVGDPPAGSSYRAIQPVGSTPTGDVGPLGLFLSSNRLTWRTCSTETGTWKSEPSLTVVGAQRFPLDIVEGFDVVSGVWIKLPSMANARTAFGACTVPGCGKVVVAGGASGTEHKPIDSVEVFDAATNCWTNLTKLRIPRAGCGLCILPKRHTAYASETDDAYGIVAVGGAKLASVLELVAVAEIGLIIEQAARQTYNSHHKVCTRICRVLILRSNCSFDCTQIKEAKAKNLVRTEAQKRTLLLDILRRHSQVQYSSSGPLRRPGDAQTLYGQGTHPEPLFNRVGGLFGGIVRPSTCCSIHFSHPAPVFSLKFMFCSMGLLHKVLAGSILIFTACVGF